MKNTEITQNWFSYVGFMGEKEDGYICPEGKDFVATDYVELRINPSEGSPLYSLIEYKKEDWMEDHPDAKPFIEKDGKHHGDYHEKGCEWTMDETIDRIIAYVHFTHETNEFNTVFFEVGSVNSRAAVEIKEYLTEDEFQEIIDFAENCMKNDFLKLTENAYWDYAEDAEDLGLIDVPENSVRKWKSLEEKIEVAKNVYNSTEEITKSFIEDGWSNNTSFSELTIEEAREKGYLWAVEGINKGRKYFKMNVCGNIFDDRGKLVFLSLNYQEKPSLETQLSAAKNITSEQEKQHLTQPETSVKKGNFGR